MNTLISKVVISSTLFIAASSYAFACQGHNKMFNKLDQNQDGQISQLEFVEYQPKSKDPAEFFSKADQDNDGIITQAEFLDHKPKKHRKGRKGKDVNPETLFNSIDIDQNEEISLSELTSHIKEKEARFAQQDRSAMFGRIDIDNNGFVTKKEMRQHKKNRKESKSNSPS